MKNLSDKSNEVVLTIGILAAIGIVLIGLFLVIMPPVKGGFSELYFEKNEDLPVLAQANEDINFAFTVISDELNTTSYSYDVSLGETKVKEGDFELRPGENITINISFFPGTSSLAYIGGVEHNQSFNISGDLADASFINLENLTMEGVFLKLDILGVPNYINLSKLKEKPFSYEYSTFSHFGDIHKIESVDFPIGRNFSTLGYTKYTDNYQIKREGDNIVMSINGEESQYNYKFEKIQVEIKANEKIYKIFFWTIVI